MKRVWVQTDSLVVVGMIKGQASWNIELRPVIQQCKLLMGLNDWEITIPHCYRETNQVANLLANLGVKYNASVAIFESPPTEVYDALYANRLGVAWARQISK